MTDSAPGPRDVLARCGAFADLSPEALDHLARCVRPRRWPAGGEIVRQGDPGDWLVVLSAGTARVDVRDGAGDVHTVAHVGPADLVGEMALLTRQRRLADVVAETDVTGYVLPAADFDDVASAWPELGVVLTGLLADRLGGAERDGLSGKIVERYRIRRCLGRGGMAVVYDAEDAETGERVALKMMSHRLMYEPGALARFRREADVAMSIVHPHLVRVHRRFHAWRTHFIVMEFCEGPTLAERLRAGPLSPRGVRTLAAQLASALLALHARGIVHRDVKPANVLLTADGAKLGDFGLAKPIAAAPDAGVTEARTIVGTPPYMSPESLGGDDAGAADDVYSLGCLVLEAATGRCPFDQTAWADLARAKRAFEVPQDLPVDDDVRAFLAHALAPSPEMRMADLRRAAAWE